MVTKVEQWGNSQGLRFPKRVLEQAQISIGDEVAIIVEQGNIIIRPVGKVRKRYDLRELVANMPESYEVEETDWGKLAGKEVW